MKLYKNRASHGLESSYFITLNLLSEGNIITLHHYCVEENENENEIGVLI